MSYCPILPTLENANIILASSSPRRKELLNSIGIFPRIFKPQVDESRKVGEAISDYIERVTQAKAEAIANNFLTEKKPQPEKALIISADTVVVLNGILLQKPNDKEQAITMLSQLSNKEHEVWTGMYFLPLGMEKKFPNYSLNKTTIQFRKIDSSEIHLYAQTGEPLDKAGGYGAQGIGSIFVDSISGSYTNVVGLPLTKCFQQLKEYFKPVIS